LARSGRTAGSDLDDEEQNKADIRWSEFVAASIVDGLLVAKLIHEGQAEWARQIVAQDIHIKLVSGMRPPKISN
jgi:hypothetical protein